MKQSPLLSLCLASVMVLASGLLSIGCTDTGTDPVGSDENVHLSVQAAAVVNPAQAQP